MALTATPSSSSVHVADVDEHDTATCRQVPFVSVPAEPSVFCTAGAPPSWFVCWYKIVADVSVSPFTPKTFSEYLLSYCLEMATPYSPKYWQKGCVGLVYCSQKASVYSARPFHASPFAIET